MNHADKFARGDSRVPETVPDVAGDDITAQLIVAQDGLAVEDAATEMYETPPWVTEEREPTLEEKVDVLAGIVEYQDEQIAEIKTACARMAQVVIRLMHAVDGAVEAESGIIGPNGERLSRKQRRDIQFGRNG